MPGGITSGMVKNLSKVCSQSGYGGLDSWVCRLQQTPKAPGATLQELWKLMGIEMRGKAAAAPISSHSLTCYKRVAASYLAGLPHGMLCLVALQVKLWWVGLGVLVRVICPWCAGQPQFPALMQKQGLKCCILLIWCSCSQCSGDLRNRWPLQ